MSRTMMHRSTMEDLRLHTDLLIGNWWPLRYGWPLGFIGGNSRRPFFFEPNQLWRLGVITSPSFFIFGGLGSGKSALMKMCGHSATMQSTALTPEPGSPRMRNRISVEYSKVNLDKPEWDPFVADLGGTPFNVWTASLNPLDPKWHGHIGELDKIADEKERLEEIGKIVDVQQRLLGNMIKLALKLEVLDVYEVNVLRIGLIRMHLLVPRSDHNIATLRNLLQNPEAPPTLQATDGSTIHFYDKEAFNRAVGLITLALNMFTAGGDFGRIFTGTQSMHEIMNRPCVAWDYTGLTDQVVEFVITVLLEQRHASYVRENMDYAVTMLLMDEIYRIMKVKAVLDSLYSLTKQNRGIGLTMMMATQQPKDLLAISDPRAADMINDIGGIFLGAGVSDEAVSMLAGRYNWDRKLTREVRNLHTKMDKGWFIFYAPRKDRALLFQTSMTGYLLDMTYTEQAAEVRDIEPEMA